MASTYGAALGAGPAAKAAALLCVTAIVGASFLDLESFVRALTDNRVTAFCGALIGRLKIELRA